MTELSREYAAALFMLAREDGREQEYADALSGVLNVFRENPEFMELLASPAVGKKDRLAAAEKALGSMVPEPVLSFIQLLASRGRIRSFDRCVSEYKKLLDAANNVSIAKVTSAVPLTWDEERKLKTKLERASGRSVALQLSLDAALIGGLVVEMDGKVMDGSLRGRLREVKEVIGR